jgi:hypothetical protein
MIDIEEDNAGLTVLMQDVDAVISPGANEAKLKQDSVHALVPGLRHLFLLKNRLHLVYPSMHTVLKGLMV